MRALAPWLDVGDVTNRELACSGHRGTVRRFTACRTCTRFLAGCGWHGTVWWLSDCPSVKQPLNSAVTQLYTSGGRDALQEYDARQQPTTQVEAWLPFCGGQRGRELQL